MTKKIFRGIISVSLAAILACFVFIMGVLYSHFEAQFQNELENEAQLAVWGYEAAGLGYFSAGTSFNNRITVVGADGIVLYDSEVDPAQMENHGNREEIVSARESGRGVAVRKSTTMQFEKTVYCAVRAADGAVVRISGDVSAVWALLLGLIQPTIIVIALVLILAALLSHRIAGRILRPIDRLDLSNPVLSEPYEELAPLVRRLNNQNKKIARQMEELRRKQDEFSIITENMAEGFVILDKNTDVLSCNPSARRILGGEFGEYNKSVFALNRSENFRFAVEEALVGRHCERQMQSGGRRYDVIANPVHDGKAVTGAIVLLMDVSEKELGEQMRREFTSNVSHELKTPLTTIFGVSDMLQSGMVKPEDIHSFAETIHSESGRMITLIDDIIKLSQLDEGAITAEREDVDLYALAGLVVARLAPMADKNDISIEVTGEHAVLHGIRPVLEEMIYNLCENAIKYNRRGGRVTVSVRGGAHPELRVSDTGIGIPADALDRVFERFYRVDKSHSRKIGGTGLGLSIVKHAAAFHGGSAHIDSTEGMGTTVWIEF